MICSECKSEIPEDVKVCPNCSAELCNNKKEKSEKRKRKSGKKVKVRGRIIAFLLILFSVIVIVFTLFASVSSNQGYRRAQKIAKKIGENPEKAYTSSKADFVSSSDYDFLNELTDFTVLNESDNRISVYGVGLPSWIVFCNEDSFGKLESVSYFDFRILKNNINGIKQKSRIDVSQISTGMKMSEADKIIGMKPYQIVFSENIISKKYKYYYKDKQNGNINAYYITVIFNSETNIVNSPAIEEKNDFMFDILKPEGF